MGAWSAEIMDDDGAEDIVEEYKILLGYGISPENAYEKITDYFYSDYKEGDEEDVYWLSIAFFQWKNGILLDEVKQRAIECIDNEEYLERWKEGKIYEKRKKVLADLKDKLLNRVNPVREKFPKCPAYLRYKTKWEAGDLLAFKMTSPIKDWELSTSEENRRGFREAQVRIQGRYLLLRVIKIGRTPVSAIVPELDYSSDAVVMLYDWVGDELPAAETADGLSFRPIMSEYWKTPKEVVSAICLVSNGTREDKKWAEITRIGQDKEFPVPEMYTRHPGAPCQVVSRFTTTLIETFALDEDEETEWYSEEKIRKIWEERDREWNAIKHIQENN